MAIATSENFSDLLTPIFRKVFFDKYKAIPEELNELFAMEASKKSEEKYSEVGSFPDLPEFNGTLTSLDSYQGYDTTITPKEYAGKFTIERKLYDDDLYGLMKRKPAGLGRAGGRTREKHKASLFNDAFSSNPTYQSGGDGQYLCSDAHPSNAVSSAQDNKGTTALTSTAVEATRIAMMDFRDDQNNKIGVHPDTLLVPRNLEQTAWEITHSKYKVDDAHNTDNFFRGKYDVIVSSYLTDSNNWFMIDRELAKECFIFINRIPLEFKQEVSFNTFQANYSVYGRWGLGWIDWRCIYGHQVS